METLKEELVVDDEEHVGDFAAEITVRKVAQRGAGGLHGGSAGA